MSWEDWAKIAPGIAPFVTLVAACGFAWWQINIARGNQRETTAKTIFREYLKLTIEHADFAAVKFKKDQREQYKWFVANFLWAAEEILAFAKGDNVWKRNLELHARVHRDYLASRDFTESELHTYSDEVQRFVEDVVADET